MRDFKFLDYTYPTRKDLDRAYIMGYKHYNEGRNISYNPYFHAETYEMWKEGWRWANLIKTTSIIAEINEQI